VKSVALFFLFALALQADVFLAKSKREVFRTLDENWYGIVLDRLQTAGCSEGIPITFQFAGRKSFHSCGIMKVMNSLTPAVLSAYDRYIFMKVSARILTLLIFATISLVLLSRAWPGLVLGAWYFLDPGFSAFRPLIETAVNVKARNFIYYTQASRFVSPLHYAIPGFLACLFFLALIRFEHHRRQWLKWVLVGSLTATLGLLSLTPVYTWLPFYFCFACLALYSWYFSNRSTYWLLLGVLFAGIAMTVLNLLSIGTIPYETEVLPRSGLFKTYFAPIFFANKWIWLSSLLLGVFSYRLFKRRWLPAILLPIGLLSIMNINMFTGYELQNFHFKDYLGILVYGGFFFWLQSRQGLCRKLISVFALAGIVTGFAYFIFCQFQTPSEMAVFSQIGDTEPVIEYVGKHLSNKNGYCEKFYPIVAIETDSACSHHHLLFIYPLSDEELMKSWIVEFKLRNESASNVREILNASAKPRSIATWEYGLKNEWVKNVAEIEGHSPENMKAVIPKWVEAYENFSNDDLLQHIASYDFFILKKDHPLAASKFLLLKEFDEFGIFKIKSSP
jgi:hypothetical protein